MQTLRFHTYGEPADVLQLESAPIPIPQPGRVRVAVHACGLNPADWALCRGLFPGKLPRGVGLDVAGVVDAFGDGVTDVAVGDRVAGAADFVGVTSAGASDFAILRAWARAPAKLDLVQAAALPMAIETAFRHLDNLQVTDGQTVLIHGAGSTIGYAAVQMALLRGAHVIATAGETYAERLRAMGAKVTSYGEGMAERIQKLAAGHVDLALDASPAAADPALVNRLVQGQADAAPEAAPTSGPMVDLVRAVGGDPRRVLTMSDMKTAAKLGVRTSFSETNTLPRYNVLAEFLQRAADGTFTVPIARTFPIADWRAALDLSLSGRARGKLVLLPGRSAT